MDICTRASLRTLSDVTDHEERVKIPSGPEMTLQRMVAEVKKAVASWDYDVVSIGYPGFVFGGRPICEPANLGRGWVGFDFKKEFGCPVRLLNDAAMQALGRSRTMQTKAES